MVLDLLLIGLAITLEPFPITAFILILSAQKGTIKGLAFILGWLACLVAVIAAVVLAYRGPAIQAQHRPLDGRPSRQAGPGHRADPVRRSPAAPDEPAPQVAGLDGQAGPALAVDRRRPRRVLQPWTLVAAGAATITQANWPPRKLPGLGALLRTRHREFPLPRAVRGIRARGVQRRLDGCGPGWTPTRPGDHRGLPAAGLLAGRQSIYLLVS